MSKFSQRLSFSPEVTHKIYGLISQIDELKGQWKMGANLSPQTLGMLKRSVIVTSSGASTRIEGARLTDEQVEKLLKGFKIFDIELYERKFPSIYTLDKAFLQSSKGIKKYIDLTKPIDFNLKDSRWYIAAERI